MAIENVGVFIVGFVVLALIFYLAGWIEGRREREARAGDHTQLTGFMSLFNEGEIAYRRGFIDWECPYLKDTPEARAWLFGWRKNFFAERPKDSDLISS